MMPRHFKLYESKESLPPFLPTLPLSVSLSLSLFISLSLSLSSLNLSHQLKKSGFIIKKHLFLLVLKEVSLYSLQMTKTPSFKISYLLNVHIKCKV